jgi:hypothetical protein
MIAMNLEDFLARSTDRAFEETTLYKVLQELPSCRPDGPWIAGGALRRTLQGKEPESDFDFFFRDKDQLECFALTLSALGLEKIRETQHHVHYRGRLGSEAAIRDVQCIRFAFYDSASAVIDSFDFTICMLAFDGKTLTLGDFTLWDLGRKRLAIHKISYPVATMRRMLKYTSQGFTACKGCLASILKAVPENPKLLEQLQIEYVD